MNHPVRQLRSGRYKQGSVEDGKLMHQSQKKVTSQSESQIKRPVKKKPSKSIAERAEEPDINHCSSKENKFSRTTIVISSFEEQEEEMRRYWASISPLRRLHDLNTLVKMAFGLTPEKLKNPRFSKKINIIPYDEYFS